MDDHVCCEGRIRGGRRRSPAWIYRLRYGDAGQPYLFQTIAAVVIGETSLLGGRGSYLGTIIGSLALVEINMLLIWLGFQPSIESQHEPGRPCQQAICLLCIWHIARQLEEAGVLALTLRSARRARLEGRGRPV